MALTATITTSPASTAVTEQKVTAILVVTNGSAFPVNLTSVQGYAIPTSAGASNYNSGVSVGVVSFGPNSNAVVPASSTLTLTFDLKFHGPSTASSTNEYVGTGSNTYSISATCYGSDGSVFAPTATTLTVNYAVTFAASQT